MYKLLIVDDDPWMRACLVEDNDWASLGFGQVFAERNGLAALARMRETFCDVVIADVKMDGMNGIQLLSTLRIEFPTAKVILISGYCDRELIRDALRYGAVDYLFKPVEESVLQELVHSTLRTIEAEAHARARENTMASQIEQSRKILQENLIREAIGGKRIGTASFPDFMVGPDARFCVAALEGDVPLRPDQMLFLREQIIKHEEMNSPATMTELAGRLIIIVGADQAVVRNKINAVIEAARPLFHLSAGISMVQSDIGLLHSTYQQALQALWKTFFLGRNQALCFEGQYPASKAYYDLPCRQQLINALLCGNGEQARFHLEEIFRVIDKYRPSRPMTLMMGVRILDAFLESVRQLNLSPEMTMGGDQDLADELEGFVTLEDMRVFFEKILEQCLTVRESRRSRKLVEDAMKMADEHLDQEISLSQIAEALYVNAAYLSRVFKESTGKNFTDYLAEQRVRWAAELLQNSQYKVYEVGEKVGYTNTQYFFRVFKKKMGVTPLVYRNRIRKGRK